MNVESILKENVFKVWSHFVVASVVGVLFNALYTMVDGIFVGQSVGEAGLASINLAWPAVTVILGIGSMLGIGASSMISIHLGQKQHAEAEKILGTVFKACIIIGTILTIGGILTADTVVRILGATEDTFQYTKDYYIIIYLLAIPYILSTTFNPIVRADGNPKLSMIMVGVGAVGNIILDWLFVMVLGWGVKGAALATGAGILLSTLCGLYYFVYGKANIKLKKVNFNINKGILKSIFKIGFVSFAMQISIGIVLLIQNNIIYTYGTTTDVAIYSVSGYIISLYTQVALGIAQGMQPLIGYHYGAELFVRMKKILTTTIVACFILGLVCYSILWIWGYPIISIFGLEGATLDIAYRRILIYCAGLPAIGIIFSMGAYYQSVMKNLQANIVTITRACVLQILFSLVLPSIMGVEGVFFSQCLADITSIFVLLIIVMIERRKDLKIIK
ncbi:MAG: MATE family efflux transporter [Cellulosilyticaceae bacterium]